MSDQTGRITWSRSTMGPIAEQRGAGGIRTHGTLLFDGFQDRCLRPLGHRSPGGPRYRTHAPGRAPAVGATRTANT